MNDMNHNNQYRILIERLAALIASQAIYEAIVNSSSPKNCHLNNPYLGKDRVEAILKREADNILFAEIVSIANALGMEVSLSFKPKE